MVYFVATYVGMGTLLLLFYAWHEYAEAEELTTNRAESTVDGAREESK